MDTYEKKYKEALERAKTIIDGKDGWNFADHIEIDPVIKEIFPELRESEDEKLRKLVIDRIRTATEMTEGLRELLLDYLEKQKEIPMPDSTELIEMWDKEEAMLKEKDFRGDTWRIAYNAFLDGFARGTCVKFEKPDIEICPHSIKSKSYLETGYPIEQKPAEPSNEELVKHPPITYTYPSDASRDEQLKMALLALLNSDLIKVAGKKFTKQDLIDWVEKQKEQPKQEVTDEEIEEMVTKRARSTGTTKSEIGFYRNGVKEAIKRFGLRSSWKPSEEQMEALNKARRFIPYNCDILESLYEQLKKL